MPIMRSIQNALGAALNRVTGRQAGQGPQQEAHAEDSGAIIQVSDRPTAGVDDGSPGPALVARLQRAQTAVLKARRENATLKKRNLELRLQTLWLNRSYEAKKRAYEAKEREYERDLKEIERLEKQIEMLKAWDEGRIDDQTFMQYLMSLETWG